MHVGIRDDSEQRLLALSKSEVRASLERRGDVWAVQAFNTSEDRYAGLDLALEAVAR